MLYGKYQFLCCLTDETILPCYKGSTFRGVFGRALKRVVCALKRQECVNVHAERALIFYSTMIP
jgi:hypothetical protein